MEKMKVPTFRQALFVTSVCYDRHGPPPCSKSVSHMLFRVGDIAQTPNHSYSLQATVLRCNILISPVYMS